MKNFFKKLALVLALAMVVASVTPTALSVSAASKITLKSGKAAPSTVYVGKTYSLKVAGTTVKFYSSNKAVATVGLTGGKLTPKAPGTVTVTAKSKKTGKTVATKKFTVNERAASVAVDQAELYLAVGGTATIKATKTPATSTDVVRFLSTDKAVATVGLTGGKVTAKANGKATINVYSMATKATKSTSKYNKTATVTVYVGTYLDTVKQVSTTKLELTFKSDVASVKTSDFKVVRDATSATLPVNTATVSDTNKKVVTVTTFEEMKDGKTYTVTYGENKVQFTATDATVTQLEITPLTVQYGTETEMKVLAKDANGVVVTEVVYGTANSNIDFTLNTTGGYINGSKLSLSKIGNTATATATYHTYTYDENGQEKNVVKTGDVTITAVEQVAITLDAYNYHIANSDVTSVDFNKLTERNTTLAVGETKNVVFKFVDSNKAEITNYENYTVVSSNTDVLLINQALSSTVKYASIIAVKTGDACILVKDAKGNVVKTLAVTIVAARKATSMTLDKYSVSVSNAATVAETAPVVVKVFDQYGKEMSTEVEAADITVECTKVSTATPTASTVNGSLATYVTIADGKVTFLGASTTAATYTYTVKAGSLSKQIVVTTKAPSGTPTYELVLGATTMDAVVKGEDDIKKTISVKLAEKLGGVINSYVAGATITVLDSTGKDVTTKYYDSANGVFKVTDNDAGVVTKTPAGSYTIKAVATIGGKDVSLVQGIVITDTQGTITAARQVQSITAPSYTSDMQMVRDTMTAAYKLVDDGTAYAIDNTKYIIPSTAEFSAEYNLYKNTSNVYTGLFVKTVVVYKYVGQTSTNVDILVPFTVTVNETINFN
ncbi:Ig-like domain-containing protein [Anaeromicropila populeti]|uniref:Ig-like domain (Group 2) n=1 Tax=Anaeromicropila populeti TaxID=37658 RepID=A0A1I6HR36_9FIRM|nr:Ig-like domain-containing protein [Anaeromicropila populeti]SFR56922.1 Ig-like domain (group 2) [Anaeromicropila populeti]